jgi:hypothetical protein
VTDDVSTTPAISRRTALARIGALTAAAVVAASLGLRRLLHKAPPPPPPQSAPPVDERRPGPLGASSLETLLVAAAAIIGLPIEREHYRDFLRWRAEHLPGYRALCERFAARIEREVARAGGPLGAREHPAQRALVEAAIADDDPHLRAGFETLRHELLLLFSRTDAWVVAGYDGWPGVPRGFDGYRDPPRRARPR